jgi:ABC-type branched-chain amino acid transport systems, ATPase component
MTLPGSGNSAQLAGLEAAGNSDLLRVTDLCVSYGHVVALDGVSLRLGEGDFVTVLGANGAGKTTLARAIACLLFAHGGSVRRGSIQLLGRELTGLRPGGSIRYGVGVVPEGRLVFPRLTVEENLICGAAARREASRSVRSGLSQVYERFPALANLRNKPAGLLSGGEQQMLAVGRALMGQPRLLICDELSLGLAPMVVKQLFEFLARLNQEQGLAILLIEQNARLALQYATYAYVLESGRLAREGASTELRDDPHFQELYLGGAGDLHDAYRAIVLNASQEAVG